MPGNACASGPHQEGKDDDCLSFSEHDDLYEATLSSSLRCACAPLLLQSLCADQCADSKASLPPLEPTPRRRSLGNVFHTLKSRCSRGQILAREQRFATHSGKAPTALNKTNGVISSPVITSHNDSPPRLARISGYHTRESSGFLEGLQRAVDDINTKYCSTPGGAEINLKSGPGKTYSHAEPTFVPIPPRSYFRPHAPRHPLEDKQHGRNGRNPQGRKGQENPCPTCGLRPEGRPEVERGVPAHRIDKILEESFKVRCRPIPRRCGEPGESRRMLTKSPTTTAPTHGSKGITNTPCQSRNPSTSLIFTAPEASGSSFRGTGVAQGSCSPFKTPAAEPLFAVGTTRLPSASSAPGEHAALEESIGGASPSNVLKVLPEDMVDTEALSARHLTPEILTGTLPTQSLKDIAATAAFRRNLAEPSCRRSSGHESEWSSMKDGSKTSIVS